MHYSTPYNQSLGAISFGPGALDFTTCMREELASKKAGGPYNPSRCTPMLTASASPGIPTYVWIGVGVLAVGGLVYFLKTRS